MAISNTLDFKYASQVSFQKEIQWEISECNAPPTPSQEGNICIIYVKFYTRYGVASEVVSDSVILKIADTEEQPDDSNQDKPESETEDSEPSKDSESDKTNLSQSTAFTFTKTLQFGSNNNQVTQLQNKLKELNFFPKEIESNGNFGPATKQAIKEYQKSKEIYPCGIVGPRTRKALNNEEFITNKDYQFTQDLKYNDKNKEVKQLQTRLQD
jgi:peptidoglycan hydrolase-like protein with peptidoglycan-binding domain